MKQNRTDQFILNVDKYTICAKKKIYIYTRGMRIYLCIVYINKETFIVARNRETACIKSWDIIRNQPKTYSQIPKKRRDSEKYDAHR